MTVASRAVLIIMDGFGIGKNSPFNAVNNAKMPFFRELLRTHPHSQLLTHGAAVGLPNGVMGNSEVGHITIGAGRIVYQDLTRISKSISEKTFFKNPVLRETLLSGAKKTSRVHLMGLLSDGGVHSHLEHLLALLDLCCELKIPHVSVHVFLDGRDTPPNSGAGYMRRLLQHPSFNSSAHTKAAIATISGRYWAMDRDKRWERVERAYLAITGQIPIVKNVTNNALAPIALIDKSYAAGKTDEFVDPILLDSALAMKDGDSAIFFNFRTDRARELTEALTAKEFAHFDRKNAVHLSAFAGMTTYDQKFQLPFAFGPQNLNHIFGQWLEERKLAQCRIAETEKYAHVTFFFNGGREKIFELEDRVLIPSPKEVPTYDLKPEMSAPAVADSAVQRILSQKYDFMLINFANADMVGHTGNYEAVIRALEALDQCLARVVGAADKSGYHVLLTADHGNAEEMMDANGQIHTQHTLNPVPAIWIAPNTGINPRSERKILSDGGLQDIMPTLCEIMGLPVPQEVTGKSLIRRG
jgi:2,3-bisphosphoglycerate-independent phosphoglycerate mutase